MMMSMMEMYPDLIRQLHEDRLTKYRRDRVGRLYDVRPARRRRA
jgi:hypothetical protein